MLGKITSYNKIGNKKEIEFILNYIIKSKRSINRNSFIEYCSESNISLQSTKCTLLLLKYLGIISPDGREGFKFTLKGFDTRQQVKMLITQVFKKLTEDDVLRHFINKQVVEYDYVSGSVVFNNNQIPSRFAVFRNLLIELNFIERWEAGNNHYVLSENHRDYFIKKILPSIQLQHELKEYRLSLMQLEDIQKKKKLFGQRAEEFVYKFERERLKSNKNLQSKVQIISGLNVAAGFDIVSYEGVNSVLPDRLIEVKAYTEKPAFYWSRNEIEVSKKKGEKYYLYLVENSLISKEDYLPIIIRNPYTHVYKADDWNKNVNTYYVTKGRLA